MKKLLFAAIILSAAAAYGRDEFSIVHSDDKSQTVVCNYYVPASGAALKQTMLDGFLFASENCADTDTDIYLLIAIANSDRVYIFRCKNRVVRKIRECEISDFMAMVEVATTTMSELRGDGI